MKPVLKVRNIQVAEWAADPQANAVKVTWAGIEITGVSVSSDGATITLLNGKEIPINPRANLRVYLRRKNDV